MTIRSGEVSRAKGEEEGGGREHLSLESNPLEFDVVATDLAWSMSELAEIERILENKEDPKRYRALDRLILLDAPLSIGKLVQLYLSKADVTDNSGDVVYRGLRESFQIDVIIPLLEAALSDPQVEPREGIADLLSVLQVRKELGVLPPEASRRRRTERMEGSLRRAYQGFSGIPREGERPCSPEHRAAQRIRAHGGDLPRVVHSGASKRIEAR